MSVTQFRSSQFAVRAYHPSRIEQNSMRSQVNCLGASRSSIFSHASLPLTLMSLSSRNMKNHRALRASIFDGVINKEPYYSLLGLSEDSTLSDLKKAYRRLAIKYHPDVNNEDPDAAAKFIEITNAYEVLLDEMKEAFDDMFEDEVMVPIKRTCYDWYSLKTLMAKCTTCGGQGHVYTSVKTPLGMKQQAMTCSSCNGTGNVFDLHTSDIS